MKTLRITARRFYEPLMVTMIFTASPTAWAVGYSGQNGHFYQQSNLIFDVSGRAEKTDPELVNARGNSFNPFDYVWLTSVAIRGKLS